MLVNVFLWLSAIALLGLSISVAPWYRLWPFEVIGGCYLWLAAFTLLLFLGGVLLKPKPPRRKLLIVLAIALGFYASSTLSGYIPRLRDMRSGGLPLTAMTYNVNYQLWDTGAVTESVRANPADLLGLIEPSDEESEALRVQVQDLYPYYYRATDGRLSLFSRHPIINAATEDFGASNYSLTATVDVDGKSVWVAVTHPRPPVSPSLFMRRNLLMQALADYGASQETTTIIMGDFNTTSWSHYFRDFAQHSGLRSVNLGHGLNPTWFYNATERSLSTTERGLQFLKIPIDHIFVSPDISVDEVTAPSPGVSDHRPLIAKLRLR
ncbi:endonuclease/exonuclease/phosphatase family protein [Vacuolonema iberomarrocanum]|uniref:endonuclease/exonuclease/phosphatase family protein n=1 Tax=Vacuolonema iberomarrocanum TaxID=3454632 RepID=UPI0019E1D959|nr:endonuclease/exonuclease/phosphatase family protein [filamentous cyanobacterium LEGE 07170]